MRRVVACLLVTGLIVLAEVGCRGRQHRPYYSDPFSGAPRARANGSPVVSESLLSPPDAQVPEVTHAGGEYEPSTTEHDEVIRSGRNFKLPESDNFDPAAPSRDLAAINDRPRSTATMDCAPDYSWIQGRLEYSALGGGVWKVRYAPLSVDDEHGGSVILDSAPDTSRFQVGDTVYVEGRVSPRDQHRALHNPVYQVQRMRIVE